MNLSYRGEKGPVACPGPSRTDSAYRMSRAFLGVAASHDNRLLRAGLEHLWQASLIDECDLAHRGRAVRWRWSQDALEAIFAAGSYGILDADILPFVRNIAGLCLHEEIGMVRRMRRPAADIPALDLCSRLSGGPETPWERARPHIASALQVLARRVGVHALCGLVRHPYSEEIVAVHVRLVHAETRWTERAMGEWPARCSSILVANPAGGKPHRVRCHDAPGLGRDMLAIQAGFTPRSCA